MLERLANLLREAESAHKAWQERSGVTDSDWATWYANWLLNNDVITHILDLKEKVG